LDISLTCELTGSSDDPYTYFEESINSEEELFWDAKEKNNSQLLQSIAHKRFLSAFLFGDFGKAATHSKEASSFPTSKTPKIQLIYHYFYHGLMAFHLYRDGEGESYLKEGKDMLEKFIIWNKHSPKTFGNKVLLLEAEYLASLFNRNRALEKYDMSIKASRDSGFVQEEGLSNEFKGHYLASIVEIPEAKDCYRQAYKCYTQWGAIAKANQVKNDHKLDISREIDQNSHKHGRDW